MTTVRSDEDLARSAAGGDRAAFDVLVQRYTGPLYSFCRQLSGNPSEAEDRAQEAFVKAYRGLARFDASRSFSSWLFKIAQNGCADARRRRGEAVGGTEIEPNREAPPLAADQIDRLEAAVAGLPVKYQAVLHHKYRLGMNAAEISRELEISHEDVRVCLHRAIRMLRERLGS